ncbi:MAG: hypothetical protein CMJ34_01630 [Phycisphaerae bacterium]|nr:hypothetical protein [Phycisphaerae bacterium]
MEAPIQGDRPEIVESRGPLVWGMDSIALHDAWWRGRGIQCVRMNTEFDRVPGVELYMLLEPDQLVTFALSDMTELIVWSFAKAFWVSVVERSEESYKEELVRDVDGEVTGVRRSYAHDERLGHRCLLTGIHEMAVDWAAAADKRGTRAAVRRHGGARVVHERVYGHCRDSSLPEDRRGFISWLVASWNDPDRIIEGIEAVRPGVFAPCGTKLDPDLICIEPAWIGGGNHDLKGRMIVGPDFLEDTRSSEVGGAVKMRPINEIDPPRGRRAGRLLPRQNIYQTVKRLFDIAMSVAVLVCFFPIMALVAIAVVVDDGFPIFFGHTRQKKNGKEFKCWKFRTMRRNAEAMVAQLQAMNKADGPQVLIENDPRVTRVGNVLRKFQLDELPQFWNVLRGDMSIVGPRPSPDRENQFCPAWREMRLSVRPGITGLWQVERTRAPGEDFQEWIKYDIEYVRTASFSQDLLIILKTAWNIVKR